ncbi:MAG TPA: hypothetical protein VK522_03955 [Pseudolabrys sp.]|nr:hypothetical protein [Pseudolabrys sp.]
MRSMNMKQWVARGATFSIALAAVALMADSANAQQPARIRGEITKTDGSMMSLKTRDGAMLDVKLADDARVAALVKATLADIKPDTFIGVAGVPEADGSIKAYSIHIFLPAQRGVVADRHGPWDGKPNSTMTNGYVANTVTVKDGDTLMVKYKEGEKKVVVTKDTVIAAVAPGNKDELKAGTPIIIMQSDKQPDGTVLAKNLYVGRGAAPGM